MYCKIQVQQVEHTASKFLLISKMCVFRQLKVEGKENILKRKVSQNIFLGEDFMAIL